MFEVTYENEVVFSKKKQGRFPQPGEVERELELRLGAEVKEGPFTVA